MSTETPIFKFYSGNKSNLQLILLALLVAQLIAIGCIFAFNKFNEGKEQAPLLNFDPKKVTKIVIEDKIQSSSNLTLLMDEKSDWLLPDTYGFPASAELTHKTLDAMSALKKGYALATTTESQERYRVGDSNYLQKICLFEHDKEVGKLLIGKPLEGTNYALRSGNDSAVCSGLLPCSKVTTKSDYWIDKRAATLKVKKIAVIDMGEFSLENFDEKWKLVSGKKTELLSFNSLRNFIYPVANCKIISVLGDKPDPDFDLNNPLLSFSVRLRDGEERKYVVSRHKKSGFYVLKISNCPWYCVGYAQDIDKIRSASFDSLKELEVASKREHSGIDLRGMLQRTKEKMEQSMDLIESSQNAK